MENQNSNSKNILSAIEALLFVHGEAIKIKRLAETLGVTEQEIADSLKALGEAMKSPDRGLDLIISGDKAMLVTKPELGEIVQKLVKDEFDSELTPAALETLSIVSYLGPITRAEIDYIRGVNSSFILRNLAVRGLVSKDTKNGNVVYDITFDFLRHMGVNSREEMPDYLKYKGLLRGFIAGESTPPASLDITRDKQDESAQEAKDEPVQSTEETKQ